MLPIKRLAQTKDFYTPAYERWINEYVEGPAWGPLDQLVRQEHVDQAGRERLAIFVASMLTRGPQTRRIILDRMIPETAPRVASEYKDAISAIEGLSSEQQEYWIGVIEDWEKMTLEEGPSEEVDLAIRSPDIPRKAAAVVSAMAWRVITVPQGYQDRFITSDNPVFIDDGYGIKPPAGELGFPLSSRVLLHASWQHKPGSLAFLTHNSSTVVREFNRRTVSRSERFLFAGFNAEWIWKLPPANKLRLHRVRL